MFLSIATPTLSNTDVAQSNNSLFFIIGGIVLAAILIGVGIWFFTKNSSNTQEQDAVAPAGWTQDPAKDLDTVIASLDNQRAHAYITKAYVGTKSIIDFKETIDLENKISSDYASDDTKKTKGSVLLNALAYEEFNKSIGTKDPKLFSDWKALISEVSKLTTIPNDKRLKLGNFYLRAYINCFDLINKTNNLKERISRIDQTIISSDNQTVNQAFFQNSILVDLRAAIKGLGSLSLTDNDINNAFNQSTSQNKAIGVINLLTNINLTASNYFLNIFA